MGIFSEYMLASSLHGAKYVVDSEKYSLYERIFWTICLTLSWVGSVFLIMASLDAFNNNGEVVDLLDVVKPHNFPSSQQFPLSLSPRTSIGIQISQQFSFVRTKTWIEFRKSPIEYLARTTTLPSRKFSVKLSTFEVKVITQFTSAPVRLRTSTRNACSATTPTMLASSEANVSTPSASAHGMENPSIVVATSFHSKRKLENVMP